ncbi:MAG: TfuA-like protein [Betaproteobacteria bacterium]
MTTCLFVGPTLHREPIPPGIERFGPAAMGSVFRAVEAGYRRIGIVDGYFGNVPSVWHKEVLFALSAGVEVWGAASMGALRAAELHAFGMIGIGRIYRLYRRGLWTDDDEVAVIHAPENLAFAPLSLSLANIRFTLRRLRRLGMLDASLEEALVRRMKDLHFSRRNAEELERHASDIAGEANPVRFAHCFSREYVDVKMADARALLASLARGGSRPRAQPVWRFPATGHWRKQFELEIADVPPLH